VADSGVRLADLLVSMSLLTDLGFGQPTEHMLRSARIGMRLGERLGLDTAQLSTLYDVGLLTYIGCPTYGDETAKIFGNDIRFRAQAAEQDLAGFPAMVFMLRRLGQGGTGIDRALQISGFMATGGRAVLEQMAGHCSAAGALADRLGLGADVRAGIEQAYARWDGRGVPDDLSGPELSLAARISHVAEACEVMERTAGIDAAVDVVRSRTGTHFDPEIVKAVTDHPERLFDHIADDALAQIMSAEPVTRPRLSDDQLDSALEAIGDFCDMRCSFFAGHARETAALAAKAAELLHMPAAEARLTYRAALVHEAGRFGVDATVWTQPGPLTASRRERMRLHVYYVERIFDRPEALRRIGLLAATHHERMDGSGYHRGLAAATLSSQARLLAAAHAYHAMLQWRPYRHALTESDARHRLLTATAQGQLDPLSVDAVLAAAGHRSSRLRAEGPLGLTARESEVLGLLAQGMANKSIGKQLQISPKTVSNHVEHIYAKLGVTNRAGATMAAMQHGLVGHSFERD
jgi:HD-GYP domain-containing protein (c-di-GMP phosphodiesterase class II)